MGLRWFQARGEKRNGHFDNFVRAVDNWMILTTKNPISEFSWMENQRAITIDRRQLRIYIFYSHIGMWHRKFCMHLSYLFCSINYVDRNLIKAFHTEWHIPYFKIRCKQLKFHYNWKIRNENILILPFFPFFSYQKNSKISLIL